ncbi:MAG: hypothetical protein IKZ55_11345, partial [Bacteroidales bacterium]|nr:hypothetical protein [Bacteroidales bacterium]
MKHKDLHLRKNDHSERFLTMAAFIFLALMPLAARAAFVVTHSGNGAGTGSYSTLNAAINACTTTSGTYTINVTSDGTMNNYCNLKNRVTINVIGNNHVVRTSGQYINQIRFEGNRADFYGTLRLHNLTLDGCGLSFEECRTVSITLDNVTFRGTEGFVAIEARAGGSGGDKTDLTINSEGTKGDVRFENCYKGFHLANVVLKYYGNVTIANCKTGVSASYDTDVAYGGFFYFYGDVTCSDCSNGGIVSDNEVYIEGKAYFARCKGFGGIYCHFIKDDFWDNNVQKHVTILGNAEFYDCCCDDNSGNPTNPWSRSNGGAIHCAGVLTLRGANNIFDGNSAPGNGGAIWTGIGYLDNCTFTNNTAGGSGGAICGYETQYITYTNDILGDLQLNNVNCSNNTAGEDGGAIYCQGSISCTGNSTLTIADNSAVRDGGGIYQDGSKPYYHSVGIPDDPCVMLTGTGVKTIIRNTAINGSGGGLCLESDAVLENVTIGGSMANKNTAGSNGGGINFNGGYIHPYYQNRFHTLTLSNTTISYNEAVYKGGGIYNGGFTELSDEIGTIICSGTDILTLTDNSAGSGGGIYNDHILTLTSSGITIINNIATQDGGAIYNNGTATLTGLTVGTSGNANGAQNGGGVFNNAGTLTVSGGSYSYNTASTNGGGFYLDGGFYRDEGTVTFSNSPSVNNNSAQNGGGIYTKIDLTLPAMTFDGNTATQDGAGIYVPSGKTLSATGATFINNVATRNGGGIYTEGTVNTSGHIPVTTTETLQRVEYIEVSTASIGSDVPTNVPYINTGINFNGGHKTWARLQRGDREVFGFYAYTGTGASQRAGYKPLSSNIQHAWPDKGNTTNSNYTSGTDMTGIFEVEQDYQHIKLTDCNGVVSNFTYSGNTSATMSATWTLLRPYVSNSNSKGRLYEAMIWDASDNLIGHYIPCRRENDEAGVYDAVSGKFLANAGSGSFSKGADVSGTYTATVTTNVPANTPVYDLTLNDCTIGTSGNGNTAAKGGGIYIEKGGVNFNTGSIGHNTASQFGGGVYIAFKAELGVSGIVTVKDNTTTRSSSTYNLYLKPSKEDDVCLQTLNDDPATGNIGKIRIKGDISGSRIGITEEPIANGFHRSLDAEGNKKRQFTLDYGTYYSSKAAEDVFFSNDNVLDIFLLTH